MDATFTRKLFPRSNPDCQGMAFPSTLFHDLLQPLMAFGFLSEQLREDLEAAGKSSPEISATLDRLCGSIATEEKLLNSLRLYAKYSAESSCFPTSSVPLSDILAALEKWLAEFHPHTTLKTSGFDSQIFVQSNTEHLVVALICLLENALKYAESTVDLSAYPSGNTIHIAVSDDGNGIPDEIFADLGTPFVRCRKKTKPRSPGLGLGLYLASQIAKRLDHSLTIFSYTDVGCTLTLELRKALPEQGRSIESKTPDSAGIRTLLISDDENCHDVAKQLLQLGCIVKAYQCSEIDNFAQRVEIEAPDVILLSEHAWERFGLSPLDASSLSVTNIILLTEDSPRQGNTFISPAGLRLKRLRQPLSMLRLSAAIASLLSQPLDDRHLGGLSNAHE